MPPASFSLWLNASTSSFAAGPFDTTPFFAPLGAVQNSQLIVDVYYVTPTGSPASPWTYIDPATFLQAAISFGNRFSYALYASTTSFTRLVDSYGPKARFVITLVSSQLNTDLTSLASVVAIFQATWQTASSSPTAQVAAQIAKVLGLGSTGNTTVLVFPSITSLTGSVSTALANLPTASGAILLGTVVELVGVNVSGIAAQYQLQAFQGAQALPGIVLPNDYNATTNPVAWIQIS
jgi:hypothetical protein